MTELNLEFGPFADSIRRQKYTIDNLTGGNETWKETSHRVAKNVLGSVNAPKDLIDEVAHRIHLRQFLPGGRYLYASGRPFHQVQNCVLNRAEDSREGWSENMYKAGMSLMTGAGLGVWYGNVRERHAVIERTGGTATGPIELMKATNEFGRGIQQGGARRAALWAGLPWWHKDIMEFIHLKDWVPEVRALKAKDFNFPATMDMTNISVTLDDIFFEAYHQEDHPYHNLAQDVYWQTIGQMLKTGEPGFSIDTGKNAGENLRNACTEITSADDSDICNLGSINLARVRSIDEMKTLTEIGTALLLAGTVYSDIPYDKIGVTREKNRRLGLGLMGIHEFLLTRGRNYGPDAELQQYLEVYETSTEIAHKYADQWNLSRPVKTRAIAPTGTIGIIAETSTGLEPLFTTAYKRRYLESGTTWKYQYVVDPIAKNLVDRGVDPEKIESAYDLAAEPQRRVDFQVWVQKYVDHSISSTINMPQWGSEHNNEDKVGPFGDMLIERLPFLRGITVYPDGARSGQPLTTVKYATAMKHIGQVFYESADICEIGKGGSCGA